MEMLSLQLHVVLVHWCNIFTQLLTETWWQELDAFQHCCPYSASEWQSDFERGMVVVAAGQSVPVAQTLLLFWDFHTHCSLTWEARMGVELGWGVTF